MPSAVVPGSWVRVAAPPARPPGRRRLRLRLLAVRRRSPVRMTRRIPPAADFCPRSRAMGQTPDPRPLRGARLALRAVDDHLHRPRLHQAGPGGHAARPRPDRQPVRLGLLRLRPGLRPFEIPTGWLGDRLGPKKVLARIVLCWLLFTALTGLVVGTGLAALVMLLCVRFLFGAGEAGAYPNIARGTRNWFPFAERGRAQGLVWTFGRWGGAVAPVLIVALTAAVRRPRLAGVAVRLRPAGRPRAGLGVGVRRLVPRPARATTRRSTRPNWPSSRGAAAAAASRPR